VFRLVYPYLWLVWDPKEAVPYLRYRGQVRRHENLDHATMRRLQWQRLTELIRYSYDKVPYYRRRFNEAGVHPSGIKAPEDLKRIPILTRSDIQQNLEDMVSVDYGPSARVRNSTGGSTGTPMHFYTDHTFTGIQVAVRSRSDRWRSYQMGDKVAVLWGADRDLPDLNWFARVRLHTFVRHRRLNSYNMTVEKMETFARLLIRWRPRHIHSYAASLYVFASFLRERGLDVIRPVAISTSAEKLWDYQRALIEDVFKCRVFDLYGSREVPNVAAECEMHRGLHVNSDDVYVELLDGGRPVQVGEVGEIIITSLAKRSMPLIRYRNGDLARASDEICPCGRPFPLLSEIVGRQNDILVTPDGQYVHGAFFNHLFFHVPGVLKFQVHQKTLREVAISIVGNKRLPPEVLETVRSKVTGHMGTSVHVDVNQVEQILPGKSGKHRYIISEVGATFARN
jgi:phenylacetate-coenzyme A ligase PaaK-like adenylate-forming protein